MRSPQGDSGKKCANVSHNRIERNHCRINVPEVLNQVIIPLGFLTASVGVLKREEVWQRSLFFFLLKRLKSPEALERERVLSSGDVPGRVQ